MAKNQGMGKAQKLLLEYRSTVWRKNLLEKIPGIGETALQACLEQIRFTRELVLSLRNNKLLGEKFYWIINASYLSDRQPGDVNEILSNIAEQYEYIPRRTFFRLRTKAIERLDNQMKSVEYR